MAKKPGEAEPLETPPAETPEQIAAREAEAEANRLAAEAEKLTHPERIKCLESALTDFQKTIKKLTDKLESTAAGTETLSQLEKTVADLKAELAEIKAKPKEELTPPQPPHTSSEPPPPSPPKPPAQTPPKSGAAPEAPREKRHYTPRGSKKNIKDAVGTLTAILVTVHHGLAVLTENPELELAEDESEALIETWAELQQYYKPVAVSPKTMAWYHFGVTFFAVYAKKVKDIRARKKAAQPQPVPRQTGTVVDLRPAGLARVEPVARPEPPVTPAPAQPPPGVAVRALTPHELSGEGGALTDGAA